VQVAEERAEVEDGSPERQEPGHEEQRRRAGRERVLLATVTAVQQQEQD
jgi:hypothetical protein